MHGRHFLVFSASSSLFHWAKVHLHQRCLKSLTAQHTKSSSRSLSQPRALWEAKQIIDKLTEDLSERQCILKVQKHVRNLGPEGPWSTEILLILKEIRYLGNCRGYRFFLFFSFQNAPISAVWAEILISYNSW